MPAPPPRSLRLDVDAGALVHNWRALRDLGSGVNTGAAVKADAYGLGVAGVVPALRDAGCDTFFVAHWSEVAGVLAHVAPQQISVLHGPLTLEDAAYARATGVRPVLNSLYQARLWQESGGGLCDLMVDTGMNRLGVSMAEWGDALLARLDVDVLMSHLACADEDSPHNAAQHARFTQACALLPARRRSLANSAGITLGPGFRFDMTRPGLSLYGGKQRPEHAGIIRQVVRPAAAIIQIRHIADGDSVGYNATFTANRPMRIGVVSLGYGDGYLRCWTGKGWLEHGGRKLGLLGLVSMDMVAVDLEGAPELHEGDWLEVPYHLPDAARQSGLSQYELLTLMGARFRR